MKLPRSPLRLRKTEKLIEKSNKKLRLLNANQNPEVREIAQELLEGLDEIGKAVAQYRGLFEHAVQGIFVGTLAGQVIDCNPAMARMLGHDSIEKMLEVKDFGAKHYFHHEDGKNKPMIEGITVDITDRKLALERLRESEEKYRRIVETTGEGFMFMDENHVIIDVNYAFCKMSGFAREELVGKTSIELADEEFRQFMLTNGEELHGSDYREIEGTLVAKDGGKIPILIHGNTLRDSQGRAMGNVAFVTDMTSHKRSLILAGEVQKSLLPQSSPDIPGLDVAGASIPCEEIGGDYFDYLWGKDYPSNIFSVVVGDISGHGVEAALLMTAARAFLRMRASQTGNISQIINAMNRHLTRDVLETGRFMTLLYMTIDTENGHLRWARAGHDPAIIYDPILDKFEELRGTGLALGLDEEFAYEENLKTGLTNEQIIAIGTDGIWEARNKHGEMYGKERFREIIRQNATAGAADILEAVYRDIARFTLGVRPEDDITLVIIKIEKDS